MFTASDITAFDLTNSYEKLDKLGDVYFPQLGAMLVKANELIEEVYDIQPNSCYKISQTPISTKGRRGNAVFKNNRNNANQVTVGLRAKGQPRALTKPDGSLCKMHFSSLSFGIADMESHYGIGVGFDPYVLNYNQIHRDTFSSCIEQLNLPIIFDLLNITPLYIDSSAEIASSMKKRKALLLSQFIQGVDPSKEDLAFIVVVFTGMFAFLDLFTRISDGETIDSSNSNYVLQFQSWLENHFDSYISTFTIKPLEYETTKISEGIVRDYFESILKQDFPTIRPSWLKSRKTNANLELDGYCVKLNLAFEYQGEYHYFHIPIFNTIVLCIAPVTMQTSPHRPNL